MTPESLPTLDRDTVIIIGGRSGLHARYREAVESIGYQCRYYEERVTSRCGPSANKIALIIVMVSMVSHPLLAQARALTDDSARIVYLRTASVSSVRQALVSLASVARLRPTNVTAVHRPRSKPTAFASYQSLSAA
ncbi:MAG TPA: DUF2325 domain-containing protein [Polyangiaceae bacterium]